MKKDTIKILILIILLVGINVDAQIKPTRKPNPKEVMVTSWQEGTETISNSNQNLRIDLALEKGVYQKVIYGDSGKRYKLQIDHNFFSDMPKEHWWVNLYEVLSKVSARKEKLGVNLLTNEPDRPGKHNFPKEDYIGVLYPEETALAYLDGEPLFGGRGFYFFKTIRKIKVESFCVIIKVEDYKFNAQNKNKLDKFVVAIEFDKCEKSQ